ncbi:hypothetical protein TsFJ059_009032 [Trichoderma semiorbis]|uniref:PiggyBac transposable element-derived protein domain-containing protein n=1 Tax=Trichoderma semiorbis TaxID=1491008 RepID=A0A9P8HAL4_9HYPO|nr:hypothetical protein TsFJ059_009032 [Trichoderma semiorbis]
MPVYPEIRNIPTNRNIVQNIFSEIISWYNRQDFCTYPHNTPVRKCWKLAAAIDLIPEPQIKLEFDPIDVFNRSQIPKALRLGLSPKPAISFTPTQAMVLALVNRLPKASYHVFTDNLFSTTTLFRLLRSQGHAATGTCRKNSGIGDAFVQAKKEENKIPWGQVIAKPTANGLVNQIAWKDNTLMLFLSTAHKGNSF